MSDPIKQQHRSDVCSLVKAAIKSDTSYFDHMTKIRIQAAFLDALHLLADVSKVEDTEAAYDKKYNEKEEDNAKEKREDTAEDQASK